MAKLLLASMGLKLNYTRIIFQFVIDYGTFFFCLMFESTDRQKIRSIRSNIDLKKDLFFHHRIIIQMPIDSCLNNNTDIIQQMGFSSFKILQRCMHIITYHKYNNYTQCGLIRSEIVKWYHKSEKVARWLIGWLCS